MRTAFILLLVLFSNLLFAQNNFAKELNQLIKDTSNQFGKFKNGFKEMRGNDSIHYSTITFEGTKENDIITNQMMTIYRSIVIDSVNEKKGEKIVDEWYQKLISVLGTRYKSEKIKTESWIPAKYGWSFKRGNSWIDISIIPIDINSSRYYVSFAITQFAGDFQNVKYGAIFL